MKPFERGDILLWKNPTNPKYRVMFEVNRVLVDSGSRPFVEAVQGSCVAACIDWVGRPQFRLIQTEPHELLYPYEECSIPPYELKDAYEKSVGI